MSSQAYLGGMGTSGVPGRDRPWMEWVARAGYAARGVMYFIIGGMAVLAAVGTGRVTGWHGALRELFARPVGKVLVVAVVVGLAGHAVWSLAQALVDPEERIRARRLPEGETAVGRWGYRVCRLFEGLFHVGLVVGGIGLITGLRVTTGAGAGAPHVGHTQRWVGWLMSMPAGRWAVALTGAGIVGFAIFEVVRAWRTRFDAMLSLGGMRPGWRRVAVDVSRFGIAARGVVFALVGMWLIVAAWDANAREAKGVGAALRELKERPEGPGVFIAVAGGLVAYGVYEWVRAGWRRVGRVEK